MECKGELTTDFFKKAESWIEGGDRNIKIEFSRVDRAEVWYYDYTAMSGGYLESFDSELPSTEALKRQRLEYAKAELARLEGE